jgi:hypothetical protein
VNSTFGTPSNPFGFVKIFVSGEDSSASDNKAKDVLGNEKLPASIKEAADRLLESNERLLEEIARVKVRASNSILPSPLSSLCTSLASLSTSLPLRPPCFTSPPRSSLLLRAPVYTLSFALSLPHPPCLQSLAGIKTLNLKHGDDL